MVTAHTAPRVSHVSTDRQRSIRRRSCTLRLKTAIHLAVDRCFRFKCRASEGKALWSETERVWLGSETFLHWSMWLEDIDIPWTVATALGAPRDVDQLRGVVLAELTTYWAEQMALLPRREQPHWLPLP